MSVRGPGLYEFLTEAELQQYFNALKKDLKVQNVGQLKYVTDDDLSALGMTKPEVRRLKKYFLKYYPQTYISKFMKILLSRKEGLDVCDVMIPEEGSDRPSIRVPNKHIIPSDAIVINKELGVGEFGVVQQGVWTNEDGDRIQVAIKCLSTERMQAQPMEFLKEAGIMHQIDAEHIVRLYGVVLEANSLMLVTELAPLRSLLECLKEPSLRVSFPVKSLCHFSVQICDGMCYLESKRLIHRDLAARNILVFSKNKIKISDFGLSRALGVGKDYYQTNFNVNLKLPIAWCAPECINYLKFTSNSDVWAYGVTLWEMFSYGFQPWAALTGQQILEAIDEPIFQRLEQPEACPRDYYTVMLKCWQHDPQKRYKFADLINVLPDMKPDELQAVRTNDDLNLSVSHKREKLTYALGDIITLLDKLPLSDKPLIWKGVLNSGKTGLFCATNTVAYLGTNVPSNKAFTRGDGKNAYSSRRRLRPEMISQPQGDLKHTGHVGLDGAYFGDIAFLADKAASNGPDKYHKLPKQIVTPYKPAEDQDQSNLLTRASSDVSDRAPLLKKVGDRGNIGPASERNWSDSASEDRSDSPFTLRSKSAVSETGTDQSRCSLAPSDRANDHEYHEISDDEKNAKNEACTFLGNDFDLGPSLMDEVFKALGNSTDSPSILDPVVGSTLHRNNSEPIDEEANLRNEIRELSSRIATQDGHKKKQATVKQISAVDEKTLDSAIAMANELASKSMQNLASSESAAGYGPPDSPPTPSYNNSNGTKFSFKLPSKHSPKAERRHFSIEANSIQDIQSSISEEAKVVYNDLIERPAPQCKGYSGGGFEPQLDEPSSNPLRLLRQGGAPVRPKVRGNKHNHNFLAAASSTIERNGTARGCSGREAATATNNLGFEPSTHQTLPRGFKPKKTPPPVKPKPPRNSSVLAAEDDLDGNPLPLPPRDRTTLTKSIATRVRHQRKYPLIIPGVMANSLLLRGAVSSGGAAFGSEKNGACSTSPRISIQHTHNPFLESSDAADGVDDEGATADGETRHERENSTLNSSAESLGSPKMPPEKPPRLYNKSSSSLDDSFESQVAYEMDALDEIQSELAAATAVQSAFQQDTDRGTGAREKFTAIDTASNVLGRSLYHSSDHVSCEDLLDFALDIPNSKRTQGPAHGIQSDEVHLLLKVMKNEVTESECLETLDACSWDVHRAVKLLQLTPLLKTLNISYSTAKRALTGFSWDVSKASTYLAARAGSPDDETRV